MPARTVEIAFLGSTAQLEASLARAGLVAKTSGTAIGAEFEKGTAKAGGAITKLSQQGAALGIPFATSLGTIGKHLDEATTKTGKLSEAMAAIGKVTLIGGGAAVAAAGAAAVKLGLDYETAGAKIRQTTGESEAQVKKLTGAFSNTAGSFEVSGQKMEQAYGEVAGQLKLTEGHALSAAEAMQFESAAARLAAASGSSLSGSTGALASVMQAYSLRAKDAAHTSDILFNASRGLGMPIEGIATAVDKLHGRLGQLAPTLTDTGALMEDIGRHGVSGGRGVMVVNTAFQTLVGGSAKVTTLLKELGVHVYDSSGKFVGLGNVIQQLQPKLAGATEQQRRFAEATLFGKGATEVMGGVINRGAADYAKYEAAVSKTGTAQAAAQVHAHTLRGEFDTMKASIETVGGKLGLILIPDLTKAAQALATGVTWLTKHKAAAEALAAVITGVLGAAIGAFVATRVAAFIAGTSRMVGGLSAVAAKMGITAGEVAAGDEAMVVSTDTAAGSIDAALIGTGIGAALVALGLAATQMSGHWESVMHKMQEVTREVANEIIAALNKIKEAAEIAAEGPLALRRLIPGAGGNIAPNIPEFGEPRGGTGTHRPGEFQGRGVMGEGGVKGQIESFFAAQGFSANAIAGIVGNVKLESGFNPNAPGGGLFQDIGGRGAGQGASTQAQLQAADRELKGSYHGAFAAIQHAKSPAEAAKLFESLFERPEGYNQPGEGGTAHTLQRERAAQEAAGHLGNASLQRQMEETSGAKPKKPAAGAKPKKAPTEPYVEPLEGAHQTSVDMGVDYTAKVHSAVKAIGAGVIEKIIGSWYEGQPLIEEKLTQGARKGQDVYYAEGLTPSVREGQRVRAGQMVGRTTTQPTGLELGFGAPGGLTAAQAAGEHKGELGTRGTRAGSEFEKFIGSIGHGGTAFSLMTKGAETAGKAAEKLAKAAEAAMKALEAHGTTLFKKYETELQTGGIKPLEKLLGTHTENLGPVKIGAGPWKPSLYNTDAGSAQNKELNALVAALRATHQKSLEELANKLVIVHREAEQTLGQELADAQSDANARTLILQTTQLKDQTQLVANMASAMVTAMKDAATAITDAFAATATAIKDATREMADASQATVSTITDRSQTEVDILGERGLYGLNLVAQQQKVALDEMKGGYDAGIADAQAAVDKAQTATDKATAATTAIVDAVTAQQNGLISQAQTNLDNVTKSVDTQVAEAQNAVAAAATGTQAQQAHAAAGLRTAEAAAGSAIQRAQTNLQEAQDTANRAEQEAATAVARAQGNAGVVIAQAEQVLTEATDRANIAEAEQQALIAKTQAEASTQYAGSGLSINIQGVNPTDAAGIADAVGWQLRSLVPVA